MISKFWDKHQNQIQRLSQKRTFLTMECNGASEFAQLDGSRLLRPIQSWMKAHAVEEFFLLLNREREEFWQNPSRTQPYQELICFDPILETLKGCVWKETLPASKIEMLLKTIVETPLEKIAARQQAPVLFSNQPLPLETVQIPKAWGYEEWYTGVEERGVVRVRVGEHATELPYALSLFQDAYLRNHPAALILLKTLNPVPAEVIGDLYLEMHEQKWEVYVVTEIDLEAWPNGVGIVKAGLNAERVFDYQKKFGEGWAKPYLRDFENQITVYEKIRREIDQQIDDLRKQEKIDLNAPLTPELTQQFFAKIPKAEERKEQQSREMLYSFVGNQEVRVGDVVTFSPYQIHSLQHGIRVIEFQTPHFERLIVMFGQKVLNQNHWDTAKALSRMKLEIYQSPSFAQLGKTAGWQKERFVDFPAFTADRITIAPQNDYTERTGNDYHLLIGVAGEGTIHCAGNSIVSLKPNEAVLLPVSLQDYTIRNSSKSRDAIPLIYLKAIPKS